MNSYRRVFDFGPERTTADHHHVIVRSPTSNGIKELQSFIDWRRRRLDPAVVAARPDCVFVITSPVLNAYDWFSSSDVDSHRLDRLSRQLTYTSLLTIDSCYFVDDGARLIELLSMTFRSKKVFRYFHQLTADQHALLHEICTNYAYRRCCGHRSLVD